MVTTKFLLILVIQLHTNEYRVAYGYELLDTMDACVAEGERRLAEKEKLFKQTRIVCEPVKDA